MKKAELISKLDQGYNITVCLTPDKAYTKLVLKTYLKSDSCDIVYPVYYNHFKPYLNSNQLTFIDTFKKVSAFTFADKVDLNIKSKQNNLTKKEMQQLVILQSLTKKEYLEQR